MDTPTRKDQYRQALSLLYKQHRQLTPSLVVETAKNPASPLHQAFEWDDTKGAHAYRLIQARTLIREVRVITVARKPETLIHVPITHEATDGSREGIYQIGSVVAQDTDGYQRALDAALADLDNALRRLQELRRLRPTEASRFATAQESITLAKLALVK